MEKIKVLVSWSGDNYAAGTGQINGAVFATNKNLEKLKSEFEDAFRFHIESSIEDGDDISEDLKNGKYIFDYEFLTSALLHKLENIVTLSAIHKATGINEKQLGHYKSGLKNPRFQQREKIIEGIHNIGKELLSVV
jgi:hypothetical protein